MGHSVSQTAHWAPNRRRFNILRARALPPRAALARERKPLSPAPPPPPPLCNPPASACPWLPVHALRRRRNERVRLRWEIR